MQTDPHDTAKAGDLAASGKEKLPVTPLRRAGQVGLSLINILLPISDVVVVYRKGVLPTVAKLRLLREILTQRSTAGETLSWAQAVERSGKTIEQLKTTFKRIRATWWGLMAAPGILSVILLLMVLANKSSLPSGTLLRAAMTILILAALGAVGFVKGLIATYRLWQLEAQRVSEEEHGTFRDFLAENRWCRQVLTLGTFR